MLLRKMDATRQISGAPPLSFTGLKLDSLKPERGAMFSPNLYAFMTSSRNIRGFAPRARVFQDRHKDLWIGYFDDTGMFVGARLSRVLCVGAKAEITCPIDLGPLAEVQGFWNRYVEVGRCAIDQDHTMCFIGDGGRWSEAGDGKERQCTWCGYRQRLFTEMVTVERSKWVAA